MLSEADIAWAAGFFEGEGNVCTVLTKAGSGRLVRYPHTNIQASQKSRAPLDRLAEILGGKVYGPYDRDGCFEWRLTGRSAWVVLKVLSPWLSARRTEQIARAKARAATGPVPITP